MLHHMHTALTALRAECSGATSIEYALIAVFISILVVGWATFVGTSVSNFFMDVGTNL